VTTSAWRSRIVGYGNVDPHDLVGNPRNWRTHPDHQRDALAGLLTEVGWVAEVLVNQRTGFVVDGHLRVASALRHGETSVPVRYVDLDDAEERLVLATFDPVSALAGSDADTLAALLEGLQPADAAVAALLKDLAPPLNKHLNPDDADLTPPAEPITKPAGWIGDHSQTTLWEIDLDRNVEGGHSTQKPVECMRRPIRNHSGDVYDPFVGSGTTIVAAEREGRGCYALDIDPGYCDVSVRRWERVSGRQAVKTHA
jgi:hypothetical protein